MAGLEAPAYKPAARPVPWHDVGGNPGFPVVKASTQDACASVIMTIYHPVSVNLNATEPVPGGEAEGNCVAVRRGGKQPDAKERSQTEVNSIRCSRTASLLANGEACAEHNLRPWHPPANAERRVLGHGWSGNVPKEIYVNGESWTGRRRARARAVQQSEPPYEPGSLVTRAEQREAGK